MEKIHPITEYLSDYHTGERNIISSRELETLSRRKSRSLRNPVVVSLPYGAAPVAARP